MVAILGSGIAGLTAALELAERNIDFELFEPSEHIGGKIRSERLDGFLIERGPHTFLSSTPLLERIIDQCNLKSHRVFASDEASTRFVVKNNRLLALPNSPLALIKSNYFSSGARFRFAREPFIKKNKSNSEESIAQFVRRRLGQEVLNYAADPYVTSTFAGVPELLSIKHAFPALYDLEYTHGSLVRGFISSRSLTPFHARYSLFSFTDGIQMLTKAMSQQFKKRIHTGSRIRKIIPAGKRWRLDIARGNHEEVCHFDAIISTLPLYDLTQVNMEVDFDLAPLTKVPYPPIRMIIMGFNHEDIAHPLDGSGLVIPGCEVSKRILSTTFSSTLFPVHAPAGKILLTTMVGGIRNPDFKNLPSEVLNEIVLTDLDELLGVYGDPLLIEHTQWQHGLPQYHLGYGVLKALLNNLEAMYPGLIFAGDYRQGVTISETMESGYVASEKILALLS